MHLRHVLSMFGIAGVLAVPPQQPVGPVSWHPRTGASTGRSRCRMRSVSKY